MQALERAVCDLPAAPGQVRRRECNYIRHGTQSLMAALHVAAGHVMASVGESRTEIDFVEYIEWIVNQAGKNEQLVFVVNQLNTHKSESLVRLMTCPNGDTQELGHKGKSGILHNMVTRMVYLEGDPLSSPADQQQRIRFVYTPKHCSWLNVVEGWFSGLQNRLLSLLSCRSTEELADKIIEYVTYYNEKWAAGINWSRLKRPISKS